MEKLKETKANIAVKLCYYRCHSNQFQLLKKKNLLRQLSFRPETCFVFVFLSFRISFLTKTENKVGVKILRNGLMRLGKKMAVFPAFFKFCGPISNFTISQFLPLQFFYQVFLSICYSFTTRITVRNKTLSYLLVSFY